MTFARGYAFDDQTAPFPTHPGHQSPSGDAMETYFTCITTCSLDDGGCITQCVEEFREHQ
jgi:hypothetical protein